jgi:cytochrome c peroxidase
MRTRLVMVLVVLTTAGCGRWVDDLACHDEGCRFTGGEWDRVKSLTGLGDPPVDDSNGLLTSVLASDDPASAIARPIVQLGWRLYYDADLSGPPTWKDSLGRPAATSRSPIPTDPAMKVPASMQISCATCHDPANGGGDVTSSPRHVTVGAGWYDVNGQQTLNAAHQRYLYWNGRADSLWSQAAQVMESGVSVNGNRLAIIATVRKKYAARYGDLLKDLPETSDASLCVSPDSCPAPDCHLFTAGGTSVCRPSIPSSGKPGSKQGCQWGDSREPFDDEYDCMRPEDQLRVTRGYVQVAKLIGAYEWFLTSAGSDFDTFVQQGPASTVLTPEAQRGLKLFVGRASCIDCHRTPLLSDGEFHNIGIPQAGAGVPTVEDCLRPETAAACDCKTGRKCLPWGACEGIQRLIDRPRGEPAGGDPCLSTEPTADPKDGEAARLSSFEFSRTSVWSDERAALEPPRLPVVKGAWRTPSLRDVALTGPYMHDGIFPSLADVVWHYDQGIAANDIGPVAVELKPLFLSAQDRADLVAFLQSLTGRPRADRDVAHAPDSP